MLVLTVCHSSRRPLAPILRASVDDQWTGFVLADGGVVRLPTSWSPALTRASSIARRSWEVVADGCAIRWPAAGELIVLHTIGESASEGPGHSTGQILEAPAPGGFLFVTARVDPPR